MYTAPEDLLKIAHSQWRDDVDRAEARRMRPDRPKLQRTWATVITLSIILLLALLVTACGAADALDTEPAAPSPRSVPSPQVDAEFDCYQLPPGSYC